MDVSLRLGCDWVAVAWCWGCMVVGVGVLGVGVAWWSAIYAIGYQAPHRLEYFNEHRECQIFLSIPKYTSVYRTLGLGHYGVVLVNSVI